MIRYCVALFLCLSLTACDLDIGFKTLGPTEYGIVFHKLPTELGGGVGSKLKRPGQAFFVWPWDSVYTIDTRIRNIEWGKKDSKDLSDWVQTRALDGNEVSLAVRIQYRIDTEVEKLRTLIQKVGTDNDAIEDIVIEAARADIRQYMNKLQTEDFISEEAKYTGERDVQQHMAERLGKYGIIVESVNLKEHRFASFKSDGSIDEAYQERIDQVKIIQERTVREKLRHDTIIADKQKQFNMEQARVNRQVAEAEGHLEQAKIRGDAYFEARKNEASAILAAGEAEVKGLIEKIEALSGPGGEALLKLELSRSLLKNNPSFILMGSGKKGDGIEVNRIDTNELIGQFGVLEGYASPQKKTPEPITLNSNETVVTEKEQ